MSLQNALGRLRNREAQLEAAEQRQTRPNSEDSKKMEHSTVFTLEDTDNDVFDIDDDLFSSAEAALSTSFEANSTSRISPGSNHSSSSKPATKHIATGSYAVTNPAISTPSLTDDCSTPKPFSPSPSSLAKLKSFTFTKRPSPQNQSEPDSRLDPPAKKRPTHPPLDCDDAFDEDLLAAFMSEPDETEQNLDHTTSHEHKASKSRHASSTGNPSRFSFKAPSSHPHKRSISSSSSEAVSHQSQPLAHYSRTPTPSTVSTPRIRSTTTSSARIPVGSTSPNTVAQSTLSQSLLRASSATPRTSLPPPASSALSTPQFGRGVAPIQRRFPGPAGILPPLAAGQSLDGIVIRTPSFPTPASTPQLKTLISTPSTRFFDSQSLLPGDDNPTDFSQGPWVTMLQDLDMDDEYSAPLLQFTIARAVKQASRQQLKNGKVTHLRVLLKSIVPACRNTSAVLKDPTGEILCTIHQTVMKEHHLELKPGAALILRQVTVFSPAPRKYYLNITPDNIVFIYPPTSGRKTASTAPRTICLTEVEKRFRDQAAKENSPQNSPRLSTSSQSPLPSSQPQLYPTHSESQTPPLPNHGDAPSNQRDGARSRGSTSSSMAPVTQQDFSANEDWQQQTNSESFFSNQLCEDEFDSIMNCLGSDLDF